MSLSMVSFVECYLVIVFPSVGVPFRVWTPEDERGGSIWAHRACPDQARKGGRGGGGGRGGI